MAEHGENECKPSLSWNFTFNSIQKSKLKPFTDHFNYDEGLVKSDPGGLVIPPDYGRHAQDIWRFQPREDDVWIVTFPKCGNLK